jgi:hypothetical protein
VSGATFKNTRFSNGLGRTAVPTGEAHRLPKKCAFLSVQTREVKAANAKNGATQGLLSPHEMAITCTKFK